MGDGEQRSPAPRVRSAAPTPRPAPPDSFDAGDDAGDDAGWDPGLKPPLMAQRPRGRRHPDRRAQREPDPADAKPADAKPADAKPGAEELKALYGRSEEGKPAPEAASGAEAGSVTGDRKPGAAPTDTPATPGGETQVIELGATSGWDPADRPAPPGAERAPAPVTATYRRTRHAAGATRRWAASPTGRLVLPGALLFAVIAATAAAGAVLLPATAPAPHAASPTDGSAEAGAPTALPETTIAPTLAPGVPGLPTTAPTGTAATPPQVGGARPADALSGWAQQVSTRVGVPVVAMQAYGYAELVVGTTMPSCRLSWTTLAALGKVESNHGSANAATLTTTGQALPPIIGLPLDGQGGRQRITDTDDGALDGDTALDRAVGPMQFIPSTWKTAGVDADNDGAKDPHDIDDAALAAANYLCASGRNLSTPADWWAAILSYNDVRPYAQSVYDEANRYGTLSRT